MKERFHLGSGNYIYEAPRNELHTYMRVLEEKPSKGKDEDGY